MEEKRELEKERGREGGRTKIVSPHVHMCSSTEKENILYDKRSIIDIRFLCVITSCLSVLCLNGGVCTVCVCQRGCGV